MSLSTSPSVSPWLISQAQVTQKPVSDGLGLDILHSLGDGPDDVRALLYDFDCQNPITGPEAIGISNETFSAVNDIFSYEVDIYPLNINNSSLLTLDTTDSMTGKSVGHLKFCTVVVTELDLSLSDQDTSSEDSLDVSFLKTQFMLTFNLTRNEFSNEVELGYPTASSSVNVTLTVNDVEAPTDITEAAVIASILVAALTNILFGVNPPEGIQFSITATILNTFILSSLISRRSLRALSDQDESVSITLAIVIIYTCTSPESCQNIQLGGVSDVVAEIQAIASAALSDGSLQAEILTIATTQNVTALQNVTVPEDGNLVSTTLNHGEFSGTVPDEFTFEVFNQYSVTACQCHDFSVQCVTEPTPIKQNEVFAVCITPSSNDVHISNLDMTISGDNGFSYSPVSYGETTYAANAPISQVLEYQAMNVVMVKTLLVGGFFNVGGGSSTVSVSGNAFLENSPAKTSAKTTGDFEIFLQVDIDSEVKEDATEKGCFMMLLKSLIG